MNNAALNQQTQTPTETLLQHRIAELESEVERLRQLAEIDGLTGCLRREALGSILERRRSFGLLPKLMTLIVVDIDHFKKVNDTYGHGAGDEVLKSVAALLRSEVPNNGLVCRMGGEEFVIALDMTPNEGGTFAAERIRSALERSAITLPQGGTLKVTASFGVAEWNSDASMMEAATRADAALYKAKNSGRNRVERAA